MNNAGGKAKKKIPAPTMTTLRGVVGRGELRKEFERSAASIKLTVFSI